MPWCSSLGAGRSRVPLEQGKGREGGSTVHTTPRRAALPYAHREFDHRERGRCRELLCYRGRTSAGLLASMPSDAATFFCCCLFCSYAPQEGGVDCRGIASTHAAVLSRRRERPLAQRMERSSGPSAERGRSPVRQGRERRR